MKRIIRIFNPLISVAGIEGYACRYKLTFNRHYHFNIKSKKWEEIAKLAEKQKKKELKKI